MKFGVREICNVVFRATQNVQIGNRIFKKGQPIFYLDSAKTSSVEGAATTVYAQGGRGNTRLIAWEGERTLTFTVEDALLSPVSFALLSGAGVVKGKDEEEVHFHQTSTVVADATTGIIDLTNALDRDEAIDPTAPLYVMKMDDDGDLTGEIVEGEFNLVTENGTVSRSKLIYGTSTTLEFNSQNGGKYAYKYPGKLDAPTMEEVQGWINTLNANDPTTLAEPLPLSLLKHPTVASYNKYVKEDTANNPWAGDRSNLWYISAKDRQITVDGETITLPLPSYFKNPVIKGKDLSGGTADNLYKETALGVAIDGTASVTDSKYYKVTGYKPSTGNWSDFISENAFTSIRATSLIKIKECDAAGGVSQNAEEIIVRLLVRTKQAIINRYFGLTATEIVENGITYKTIDAAVASAADSLAFLNTYFSVPDGTKENKAYEVANTQFAQAFSRSVAKRAFDAIVGNPLMIDYYVIKKSASVTELQIDAQNFAGYYYVEADTLFRRQIDGKDLPANLTFPNVKIQSNFTFTMASTGDPSTFTFTMDAFPGYTYFDKRKKVLCAIQIVDDKETKTSYNKTVFPHKTGVTLEASMNDSSPDIYDEYNHTLGAVEIDEG